jgi:hypothetical protein
MPGYLPCPDTHGTLMFPPQDDAFVLSETSPATTVTETMTTIDSGVKCSVKGEGANYSLSVEIEENKPTGVGVFQLTNVTVNDGLGNGNLYWIYQGFGFEGVACGVDVDMRPATEDNPSTLFIEPGMAKITFQCNPFLNTDNQACSASGTVYVANCSK